MRTRWAFAVVVGLVVFAVVRALIATRTDGFTIDEPWHIVAGVSHLREGDYRLNPLPAILTRVNLDSVEVLVPAAWD